MTDALVIGAGHNGLACAAYLARAGRSVVVVEARGQVGGCASSVPAIGARVNICNCDHTMVLGSGIIEDLDLAAYGLRYLAVDPVGIAIGWGAEPPFVQWRSVSRTLDGLAATDSSAAAAYRRYLDVAFPVARLLLAVQGAPATSRAMMAAAASRRLRGSTTLLRWARSSLLEVLSSFGLPPWMIAAAETAGPAVWGLPPDAPGTGLAAASFALKHLVGVGRPVGGSGALPDALAACVVAHGGAIMTDTRVTKVVVRDGRVVGAGLANGSVLAARTVVSAVDPRTLFVDWLDGVPAAARTRARWLGRPFPDGYESKLDAVVGALPALRSLVDLPAEVRNLPTTLVCPTPAQQIAGFAAARRGLVSDPPMFFVNTPSVLDESMRPSPDTHLLSLEVLWTPYSIRGGWAESAEPRRWLEQLASICGPGLVESVRNWRAMTPPDYEDQFSMARGYAPSFPGGVLAALVGRPRELSRYRTAIDGLYVTGAGTFPGAGVWGASGRNAASAILRRVA
jgi:phytoene dehydrogenase-like protein